MAKQRSKMDEMAHLKINEQDIENAEKELP